MILVPMPGGLDDLPDAGEFDLPVQVPQRSSRVSVKRRRVPRTAFAFLHRHLQSRDVFNGLYHFSDRMRLPGAQVVEEVGSGLREFREGRDVSAGQIVDMNVVPEAGAIRRRIVFSKNRHGLPASGRGVNHQRDEVGFRIVILADGTIFGRACGIEGI